MRYTVLRCLRQALSLLACFGVLVLAGTPASAADNFTPTADFTDNGDGTVMHKLTGLTWMRCSMGQTWTGSSCSGAASTHTWDAAKALTSNFAGKSDWRLPHEWELVTIVDFDIPPPGPTINTAIFPNTPGGFFLSGTPKTNDSGTIWLVNFYGGGAHTGGRYSPYHVRLVRGGQPAATLATPTADFTDNGDGTVTHQKTQLTWKRCAEGQSWTGSTCSGTATNYTYTQALVLTSAFGGKSDWRAPNVQELLSLVEYGATQTTINTAIFPNAPSGIWSGSPSGYGSNYAWFLDFINGINFADGNASNKTSIHPTRLVRGTQTSSSSGSNDLTSGLVAHYPFDGNANDASGNGNNGIEHGGVTYVNGKMGFSANYDGIDDYISVRHNSLLSLGNSFTLSVWANIPTGANDAIRIIDKATGGTCNGWVFDTHDSSLPGLRMRLDVSCPWVNSKSAFSPDSWHHLLVTVDKLNATFFLDGIADGTGTISQPPSNTLDLFIGSAHPPDIDSMYKGQLDELRIYNRALSAAEVQQIYTLGLSTPTPFTLTTTLSGPGTLTSNPTGISCGSDCSESYASGTRVTLTATPATGYAFIGWSGACSGTATTCTVTMDAAKTVKAGFTAQNPSDCIFDWAERDFPQYFSPAKASSAYYQNYYYRYYAATGVYLATNDNILWALGPPTNNALLSLGPMSNFLQAAGCQ